MTSKEYLHEAVICSIVAKGYENLGLVANAEYFKQRALYMLAKTLEALAFESHARAVPLKT